MQERNQSGREHRQAEQNKDHQPKEIKRLETLFSEVQAVKMINIRHLTQTGDEKQEPGLALKYSPLVFKAVELQLKLTLEIKKSRDADNLPENLEIIMKAMSMVPELKPYMKKEKIINQIIERLKELARAERESEK